MKWIKYAWNLYFYTDYGSNPDKSEILLDKIIAPVDMADSPEYHMRSVDLRVPSVAGFLPSIVAAVWFMIHQVCWDFMSITNDLTYILQADKL